MSTLADALGPGRVEEIARKPKPPALVIEVAYGYSCWRKFDLVKFLERVGNDPSEQQAYWTTDLTEWGYDQEWERPLAVLLAWDQPDVSFGLGGVECLYDDTIDIEVSDVRVKVRNHVEVPHSADRNARRWTEADFRLLGGLLPWLAPEEPLSPEDLARLPGPLDSPLF
jgi:hypothetical protein